MVLQDGRGHRHAGLRGADRDGHPADRVVGPNRPPERLDEPAEGRQIRAVDALEVDRHPVQAARSDEGHDLGDRSPLGNAACAGTPGS